MTLHATSKRNSPFTAQQWRTLLAGFSLMLLSGLVNGWSIFAEAIEGDLNLLRQDTTLVFSISLSVSIGGQMLAGALNRRIKSGAIYRLIAVLSFVGFFGASMAKGIGGIYLFYGVFSGLSIGMIYNLVLSGVAAQFETSISLVTGILLMGFGVGPLVLGMGAAALLDAVGWRSTFVVLAVFYAALLLLSSILIPSGRSADCEGTGNHAGLSTGQMLRSRSYQYLFAWCTAVGAAVLILMGHASLVSRDIGAGMAAASLMTGVVSLASGVTRPFFGYLADRYGGHLLKNALTACCALGSAALFAGYVLGSMPVLALGYVLVGAANGGSAVYICDFVRERYGSAHYGMNIAVTNIYMILGSILGTALAGTIKTQTGQYTLAFAVMLAFSAFGILFSLLLDREQRKERSH
jgi:OFA family oxalate/formate antiporter-like MFS transporter